MGGVSIKGDFEDAVSGADLVGRVPFEIFGGGVVDVDGFPVGIFAGEEGATVGVEFIRELRGS